MESGTPPDRPSDQPGSDPPEPRETPPGGPPAEGPQSPAPGPPNQGPGPQSPVPPAAPGAPQSPAPGPQSPPPQPWAPPGQAQPGPEGIPGQGQVPPGGWQTPATQQQQWVGAPLAGWWSRVGATVLDGLILLIPVIVLVVIIVGVAAGSEAGAIVTAIIGFLSYFIATLFYAPVLMSRGGERNGQTFGKQALGIRVTRDNGQPFDMGAAFIRELAVKNLLFGFIGSFFFSIPTLLDWLWPLWDDQNRALHDMVVKTHVMKT